MGAFSIQYLDFNISGRPSSRGLFTQLPNSNSGHGPSAAALLLWVATNSKWNQCDFESSWANTVEKSWTHMITWPVHALNQVVHPASKLSFRLWHCCSKLQPIQRGTSVFFASSWPNTVEKSQTHVTSVCLDPSISPSFQILIQTTTLLLSTLPPIQSGARPPDCLHACVLCSPLYISDHLHTPHILTNLWPAGLWPFIPFGHHTLPPNFIPKSVHLNAFPSPCTLEKAKSCLRTMLLQSHHNQIRRAKGPPPLLKWTLLRGTFLGWGGSKDGR